MNFGPVGGFDYREAAGAFSRIFEGAFLKASQRVLSDYVSMTDGGVEILVRVKDDHWSGCVIITGEGAVEDLEYDEFESFNDLTNWLVAVRYLWDTELRPLDGGWHDEGGIPLNTGAVAEQWSYRTVRTPLTVFYDDPEGWCVGVGRSPREATRGRIHGPWQNIKHAKLFAENWVTLEGVWVPRDGGIVRVGKPPVEYDVLIAPVAGGWETPRTKGQTHESPLDAIQAFEAAERRAKAATKI